MSKEMSAKDAFIILRNRKTICEDDPNPDHIKNLSATVQKKIIEEGRKGVERNEAHLDDISLRLAAVLLEFTLVDLQDDKPVKICHDIEFASLYTKIPLQVAQQRIKEFEENLTIGMLMRPV